MDFLSCIEYSGIQERGHMKTQLWAVGVVLLGLLTGCGSSSSNAAPIPSSTTTSVHAEAGDNAEINTAADLVATTKDSLNELENDVTTGNTQDVQNMVDNGLK